MMVCVFFWINKSLRANKRSDPVFFWNCYFLKEKEWVNNALSFHLKEVIFFLVSFVYTHTLACAALRSWRPYPGCHNTTWCHPRPSLHARISRHGYYHTDWLRHVRNRWVHISHGTFGLLRCCEEVLNRLGKPSPSIISSIKPHNSITYGIVKVNKKTTAWAWWSFSFFICANILRMFCVCSIFSVWSWYLWRN